MDIVSIDNIFIHGLEFSSLESYKIKMRTNDTTFKVLKIRNCPKVKDLMEIVTQTEYCKALKETSHLFFIHVEITEDINGLTEPELVSLLTLTDKARPLVLQLIFKDTRTMIFYKDENHEQFEKIFSIQPLTFDELLEKIRSDEDETCRFKLLLQALTSDWFGKFNGNLLETSLYKNTDEREKSLVMNELAKKSSLSLRFMQLFKADSSPTINVINSSLKFLGVGRILALLDLPLNYNCNEILIREKQVQIDDIKASCKKSLLEMSVEQKNSEAVRYFSKSFNFDLDSAARLAIRIKDYQSFAELIDAGAKYPKDFNNANITDPTATERLNNIKKERQSFHDIIAKGLFEEVKKRAKQSNCKTFFNTDDKSVLTTALQHSQFRIFAFLQSKGFSIKGDQHFQATWEKLTPDQKAQLRDAYKEFFNVPDSHLVALLSKSRLSLGSIEGENDYFGIIRTMYEQMNSIVEIQAVMKAIAYSENLNIVFDFSKSSVSEMDPTKKGNVAGTSYIYKGYIYLAVKNYQNSFYALLGTLAHEMTHYALNSVYSNGCKPFSKYDVESEKAFDVIVKQTEKIVIDSEGTSDPIIKRVYTVYNSSDWQAELIVRVSQILAQYSQISDSLKLQELKETFHELFSFFYGKVLGDLKGHEKVVYFKSLVTEINQSDSVYGLICYENNHFNLNSNEIIIQSAGLTIVSSNVKIITLTSIYKSLSERKDGDCHMYISIQKIVNNDTLLRKLETVFESLAGSKLVIDCTNSLKTYDRHLINFLGPLHVRNRVVLVGTSKECNSFKKTFSLLEKVQSAEHKWSQVEEGYRETLLERNICFQSFSIKLKDLELEKSTEVMNELPLNSLLIGREIKVNEQTISNVPFFISRKFILKDPREDSDENEERNRKTAFLNLGKRKLDQIFQGANLGTEKVKAEKMVLKDELELIVKSSDEMVTYGNEVKVVIISGKAGAGKSSILNEISRQLREKFKAHWHSLISLRDHVKDFEAIEVQDDVVFEDFVLSTILKRQPIFDRKIFLHLFQQGRCFILLDGFDEISPKYKEVWMKVLKSFKPESGNQLWVTTRSHMEQSLENSLKSLSCSLLPLSSPQQIEYLTKFWARNGQNLLETEDMVRNLIEKLKKLSASVVTSFETPLVLSMLAKIYEEPNSTLNLASMQTVNLYSIYDKFTKLLKKKWEEEKGELAKEDIQQILESKVNIWEVHEKLAIKQLFPYEYNSFKVNLNYDRKVWTAMRLSRIGIYLSKKKEGSFLHQTFAEFFVARFICDNLDSNRKELAGIVRLLIKVLQREDNILIRVFLNQAVESKKLRVFESNEKFKIFSVLIANHIEETKSFKLLFNIAAEPCDNLINLVARAAKFFDKRIVIEMLSFECQNNTLSCPGQTLNALQKAARMNNKHVLEKMFEIIYLLEREDQKKIAQKLSSLEKNIFHRAVCNEEYEEVFTTSVDCLEKVLEIDELKCLLYQKDEETFNIFHLVANFNNEKSLSEIFTIFFDRLPVNELRKMLLEKNSSGENCLLIATSFNNKSVVKKLLSLSAVLTDVERKDFFQTRGFDGRNVFHHAAQNLVDDEVFSTSIECAAEIISKGEVKTLLQQNSYDQLNILHIGLRNENLREKVFETLIQHLTYKELKRMLKTNYEAVIKFQDETKRLNSFIKNRFPKSLNIIVEQLAASGFYFSGKTPGEYDAVTCFKCGISICKWEKHNFPMEVHEMFISACPFVKAFKAGKVKTKTAINYNHDAK